MKRKKKNLKNKIRINVNPSHEQFLENKLSSTYKTKWTTIRDAEMWAIDAIENSAAENKN